MKPELKLQPELAEESEKQAHMLLKLIVAKCTWFNLVTSIDQMFARMVDDKSVSEHYERVLYRVTFLTFNHQALSFACESPVWAMVAYLWLKDRADQIVWTCRIEEVQITYDESLEKHVALEPIGIASFQHTRVHALLASREALNLIYRQDGHIEQSRLDTALELHRESCGMFGYTNNADDIKI